MQSLKALKKRQRAGGGDVKRIVVEGLVKRERNASKV